MTTLNNGSSTPYGNDEVTSERTSTHQTMNGVSIIGIAVPIALIMTFSVLAVLVTTFVMFRKRGKKLAAPVIKISSSSKSNETAVTNNINTANPPGVQYDSCYFEIQLYSDMSTSDESRPLQNSSENIEDKKGSNIEPETSKMEENKIHVKSTPIYAVINKEKYISKKKHDMENMYSCVNKEAPPVIPMKSEILLSYLEEQ